MEHTSIGSLLSTYPTTVTGVPDNDAPMRYHSITGLSGADVSNFTDFHGNFINDQNHETKSDKGR